MGRAGLGKERKPLFTWQLNGLMYLLFEIPSVLLGVVHSVSNQADMVTELRDAETCNCALQEVLDVDETSTVHLRVWFFHVNHENEIHCK